MSTFQVEIRVRFKDGILDPQSQAIEMALKQLEFKTIRSVRCEKLFVICLEAESEGEASQKGRQMAHKILANVVMENFEVTARSL